MNHSIFLSRIPKTFIAVALFLVTLFNLYLLFHLYQPKIEIAPRIDGNSLFSKPSKIPYQRDPKQERLLIPSKWTDESLEKYSNLKCLSYDPDTDKAASEFRSCIFERVCIPTKNKHEILFFDKKNKERFVVYDEMGYIDREQNIFQFNSYYQIEGEKPLNKIRREYRKFFKKDDPKVEYIEDTAVITAGVSYDNIGHFLFDKLFSIFKAFVDFNEEPPRNFTHFYGDFGGYEKFKHIYKYFNKGQVYNFDKFEEREKEYVCFKKVLIGANALTFTPFCPNTRTARDRYFYYGHKGESLRMAPDLWKYRNFILENMFGDKEIEPPKKHRITIYKKQGKREILNFDEIVEMIEKKFGKEMEIQVMNPTDITFEEEVRNLLNTTILLSSCGGISMPGFFMNHGSSLIVTDFAGVGENWSPTYSSHLDAHVWNALFWINDYYISIEKNIVWPEGVKERAITSNTSPFLLTRFSVNLVAPEENVEYLINTALRKMSNN